MEEVLSQFQQQGLLGAIIIVLAFVVIWQQKRIDVKDKQVFDLQDKIKVDADAHTTIYVSTTREMVGTQRDSLNAINILQKSVETLVTAVQGLVNDKGN